MSIIRVEKSKNYTVMSNYHLQERRMSLKAKGLLSLMLSLPEDWDYSIAGLVNICKENETSIKTALDELKQFGYLQVNKYMPSKENGGRIEYEYIVKEKPDNLEIQDHKKQDIEILHLENPGQLNNISKDIFTNNKNTFSKEKDMRVFGKKTLVSINTPKKEIKPKLDKNQILANNVKKGLYKFNLNTREIELLGKWIDELYFKNKGIGSDALNIAITQLLDIDINRREEVIKKATLNAWRDFRYCVNIDNKDKLHINNNVIIDESQRDQDLKEIKAKIKDGGQKDVDYF